MPLKRSLIAIAAFAAAGAAFAGNTTVNIVGASQPGSSPSISVDGGADFSIVNSYEFIITSTAPAGSFATFCLEPFQHLITPHVYDNSGSFTVAQAAALSKLFTGANWQSWNYAADGVTNEVAREGLQLGVWEIFNDTSGEFDLLGGSFGVGMDGKYNPLGDGQTGLAVAFATNAFNNGNLSLASSLVHLTDPIQQDLVIAVPEPTTYALMLGGLLSIGFVARRRRNS